jgi:alpha-L-fucosidase
MMTLPSAPLPAAIKRWKDLRLGLFLHWGPVSLVGTEIGWSRDREVPAAEYDELYRRFNPFRFDAGAWAATAKSAGMKYVVLTVKHHDGFCLWDTKQTDYNIMNTPFKRDVVRELSDACRQAGLGFGTYYSTCDWHHPDFPLAGQGGSVPRKKSNLDRYTSYLKSQVRELLENYGPLVTLWFDVPQRFDARHGQGIIDMARAIQPDILINNRTGARGDYDTPEQRVGGFNLDRPWESCITIGQQWAWKPGEKLKPLRECLHALIRTAGGDGNLLLNVGPAPDGSIERRQVARLGQIGSWLERYGESIHATSGGPYCPDESFACTRKENHIYLHLLKARGTTIQLPCLPAKVLGAHLLTGGKATVRQDDSCLRVTVSRNDPARLDTLVRLDLDQPAQDVHLLDTVHESPA